MTRIALVRSLAGLATTCALLLALAGCGGGGSATNPPVNPPPPNLQLKQPVEDPARPGSVGGTIFSLNGGVIDYPYGAEVTLVGVDAQGAPYADQTRSTIRGGYRFASVPAGTYTVTATVRSSVVPDLVLTGSVERVVVRGNIANLMVNILTGVADESIVFRGQVTQNGQPAAGATVTADVSAQTVDRTMDLVSVLVSTTTDAEGRYTLTVPSGATSYYLAAHSDSSMVSESSKMVQVPPGEKVVDLLLDNAVKPVFGTLQLDMVSATLPAPTAQASQQALVSRAAVARALGNTAMADRLERVARTRTATSRSAGSIIENDLYWSLLQSDVGVRGFHIYRSTTVQGPYTYIGSAMDPYLMFFFDNDPALDKVDTHYYTVTSFAANGQTSSPAQPMPATPLPQIAVTGPADGATVPKATAQVSWAPVSGAKSYLVLVYYNAPPSFNTAPFRSPYIYTHGETSESMADLPAGTYWWSVSAYNVEDPTYATAATYSAYRKIVIE